MEDLSLHVLDVAENALSAGADRVEVRIAEKQKEDALVIEIEDNGRGMDDEEVSRALDPFYTTGSGKRVGLGLPLLAQAAGEAGGKINVSVKRDNTGHVQTIVRDTGKGIPPEAVDRIFDRFYQADTSLSRKTEGTGLGLSIVKFIIDAHKGKIDVESKPEKGSEFTVKLPPI